MKNFFSMLGNNIDFNFALAIIAILGTAGFLSLQFNEANTEFEIINASMYSVVSSGGSDSRENQSVDLELDELGKSLDGLNF